LSMIGGLSIICSSLALGNQSPVVTFFQGKEASDSCFALSF
jgi:hypothetical protein